MLKGLDQVGLIRAAMFTGIKDRKQKYHDVSDIDEGEVIDRLQTLVQQNPEELENWDKFMIGHLHSVTSDTINYCLPKGQVSSLSNSRHPKTSTYTERCLGQAISEQQPVVDDYIRGERQ